MTAELGVPVAIAIATLNLLALIALAWPARRRRGAAEPGAAAAAPAQAARAGDPRADDVEEIEAAESASWRARGEDRLSADLARWKSRAASGESLPGTAVPRRAASKGTDPRWAA
jgi:hypothetical protein